MTSSRSILAEATASLRGAIEVRVREDRVLLDRTTSRLRRQVQDAMLDSASAMPSGVRIEAFTDASWVEIDLVCVRRVFDEREPSTAHVDAFVDGELRSSAWVAPHDETRVSAQPVGGPRALEHATTAATLHLPLGESTRAGLLRLWFPTSVEIAIVDVRAPVGASWRACDHGPPEWIHYGSSISQCAEVEHPCDSWPARVALAADLSLTNMGLGGQCHLDIGVAQIIRDRKAHLISLEVGTNIVIQGSLTRRTFVSALHGFLDVVREGHPDTPLVVMTPIHCALLESRSERPDGTLSLPLVRELLEEHVALRDDRALQVIDGRTLLGPDEADLLPDGVHPNEEGYRLVAERFHRRLGDLGLPFGQRMHDAK